MIDMQNYIECSIRGEQLNISYSDNNKESLPVLLLVHGNSSSKNSFELQIKFFNDFFRVVAVDLPGHGDSSKIKQNNYSLAFMSDSLQSFVETLGIEVSYLMGHSLGGHVCLQSLNIISPLKVITWGTPPMTNPPVMEKMFLGNPVANFFFSEEVTNENLKELFLESFENENLKELENFIERFRKTDPCFRAQLLSELSTLVYRDEILELEKYEGEVLFLMGDNEKIINNEYISENCFEYGIKKINNTSHFAHIENTDDFNFEVLNFLKSNMNKKNNPKAVWV